MPKPKRVFTPRQARAVELLTFYMRKAFEADHGVGAWSPQNDRDIRQLVEDLTDPGDTARAFAEEMKAATLKGKL